MTDNTIEILLEESQHRPLSPTEAEQLRLLTRHDAVLAAAERRAAAIVRRRRLAGAAATAIVAVVGAFWLLPQRSEAPAEVVLAPAAAESVSTVDAPPREPIEAPARPEPRQMAATHPTPQQRAAVPTSSRKEEPVVMCNNQCDADSVISDIWKFLSA